MKGLLRSFTEVSGTNPISAATVFCGGELHVFDGVTNAIDYARTTTGIAIVVSQCQEKISDSAAQATGELNITEFYNGACVQLESFQSKTSLAEERKLNCRFCAAQGSDSRENLLIAGWNTDPGNSICPQHNTEAYLSNLD